VRNDAPMQKMKIPPGFIACGFSSVAALRRAAPEFVENSVLFAPAEGEFENPWEDPAAIAVTMTAATLDSLTTYVAGLRKGT
jgi:hypothetical protein